MQVGEDVIIVTPTRNVGGTTCTTPISTSSTPVQPSSSSSANISDTPSYISSSVSSKDPKCPSIPSHWSGSTQKAIDDKKLDAKIHCDIVRTMVTLLVAKSGPHPSKSEIELFSRELILKYPYMRDV